MMIPLRRCRSSLVPEKKSAMNRQISCKTFLMMATLSVLSTALPVTSQEPPPKGAKPNPDKEEALSGDEKATRRAAEQFVNTIELEMLSDDKWAKVKRIEKPLLYFSWSIIARGIALGVRRQGSLRRPARKSIVWPAQALLSQSNRH
jgi:hypothetical protein